MEKVFTIKNGDISDGFHTFDELYQHRNALYLRLCEAGVGKVFYKVESNEWMIVYLILPEGQISYHVKLDNESADRIMRIGKSIVNEIFDGHTSNDVLNRLNRKVSLDLEMEVMEG